MQSEIWSYWLYLWSRNSSKQRTKLWILETLCESTKKWPKCSRKFWILFFKGPDQPKTMCPNTPPRTYSFSVVAFICRSMEVVGAYKAFFDRLGIQSTLQNHPSFPIHTHIYTPIVSWLLCTSAYEPPTFGVRCLAQGLNNMWTAGTGAWTSNLPITE